MPQAQELPASERERLQLEQIRKQLQHQLAMELNQKRQHLLEILRRREDLEISLGLVIQPKAKTSPTR